MACQIDALQIDPRYKQAMAQFCSNPENEQVCQQICELPPEVLNEQIGKIENELAKWTTDGVPDELRQEVSNQDPQVAQDMDRFMEETAPQLLQQEQQLRGDSATPPPVQEFARGGLATQGRWGDTNVAHVAPGEVVVPRGVFTQNPGLREGLGRVMLNSGADPRYYTVGNPRNRINPRTGHPEYGFLGKALGAIVGGILGGPAGFAAGAGLGAAAGGMLIDGDSFGQAAMWGLGIYGGAGLLGGSGAFGTAYQAGAPAWAGGGGLSAAGIAAANEAALAQSAGGLANLSAGEIAAGAAEYGGAGAFEGAFGTSWGMPAFPDGVVTPQTAGSSVTKLPGTVPKAPLASGSGAATPSFLDDPLGWMGENKLETALIGATLMGAMEEPQLPREPSGAEYFNEYDAYKDCLAAGGSEESCRTQHPKGWAEIAPPPTSQWLAGTADYGTPGGAGAPTGGIPLESQPWYSQMPLFGYANGGYINGAGSETSDSIPARLSNNEFVLTADAVRGAGNGSVKRGASKLYDLMDKLERRARNG